MSKLEMPIEDFAIAVSKENARLNAEIERLQAENEAGLRNTLAMQNAANVLRIRAEKAEAEIDRLREALEPFSKLFLYPDDLGFEAAEDIRADQDWDEDDNDMQTAIVFVLRRDIRCARAALEQNK